MPSPVDGTAGGRFGSVQHDDKGHIRIGARVMGIDINEEIIKPRVEAKRLEAKPIQDQVEISNKKLEKLSQLNDLVRSFHSASRALTNQDSVDGGGLNLFSQRAPIVTTSDGTPPGSNIAVTVANGTQPTNFELTIQQTTSIDSKLGTVNIASTSTPLNLTGNIVIGSGAGPQTIPVTTGMALQDVITAINAYTGLTNVTASYMNMGVAGPYRLQLSQTTATPATPINMAGTTASFMETNFGINIPQAGAEVKLGTMAFASPTAALGYAGTININGTPIAIGAGNALNDVAAAIVAQSATTNVTADVIVSGGATPTYTLRIYGTTPGVPMNFAGTTQSFLETSFGINAPETAADTKLGTVLLASATTALGLAGTVSLNGISLNVLGTMALNDIATLINGQTGSTNVVADVITSGTGFKLRIYSNTIGTPINFTGTSTNFLETNFGISSATTDPTTLDVNETYFPLHAVMTYNGTPNIRRGSDSVTDLVPGVTLSLARASPTTTLNITVDYDRASVYTGIQAFVSSYNAIADFVAKATAVKVDGRNTKLDDDAILFGDQTVASIKRNFRDILSGSVPVGPLSTMQSLATIGVTFDRGNSSKLSMDGTVLVNGTPFTVLQMVNDQTQYNNVAAVFGNTATSDTQGFSTVYFPKNLQTPLMDGQPGLANQPVTVTYMTDGSGNPTATFTVDGQVYPAVVSNGQITGAPSTVSGFSPVLMGLTVSYAGYSTIPVSSTVSANITIVEGIADSVSDSAYSYINTNIDTNDPRSNIKVGLILKRVYELTKKNHKDQEKIELINQRADRIQIQLDKQYSTLYAKQIAFENMEMMLNTQLAVLMGSH